MDINFSMERSRQDVSYFYRWLGYTWGKHIGEWMDMYGTRGDCLKFTGFVLSHPVTTVNLLHCE